MDLSLKVRIMDDRRVPFMGPGPLRLLERIGRLKSINKAAGDMKLSYVKALRMLGRLEQATGRKFVIRRRGGCDRGGAELTPFALRFMSEYEKLAIQIQRDAHARFKTFRAGVARSAHGRGAVDRDHSSSRKPERLQGERRKKP